MLNPFGSRVEAIFVVDGHRISTLLSRVNGVYFTLRAKLSRVACIGDDQFCGDLLHGLGGNDIVIVTSHKAEYYGKKCTNVE